MRHYENLRDYQRLGIQHLVNNPRSALFAQPGMGKTVMTETAIDILRLSGDIDKTLVVMPKRVLDTEGWQRELTKWSHLGDLAIEAIVGSPAERREKLHSPKPIHLINYELIPWLLEETVRDWPYSLVVLDESTKVKGYDSTWFMGNPKTKDVVPVGAKVKLQDGREAIITKEGPRKLPGSAKILTRRVPPENRRDTVTIEFSPTPGLKHAAARSSHWIDLTGTPIPNGVQDLWSQVYLLDAGARLGENITRFRERFMQTHPYVKHKWVPQRDALERVIPLIDDLCLSLIAKDWLDLPDLVPNVIDVAMPGECWAEYNHLEDEFFLRLTDALIEAPNSAVLSSKLLQYSAGAMYVKDDGYREIHDNRLEALADLAEQVAGPMLIAYHFDFNVTRIKKALPGAVEFDGTRGMIDAFAKGKIQHLMIHPQSAGHGVDGLQDGTDTIVFFESNWSLEAHDQVIERIGPTRQLQSGHPRPVFVHYLATRGTHDDLVLQRLIEKKSTQDILLDAVNARKKL
jgi:hypothetical protein